MTVGEEVGGLTADMCTVESSTHQLMTCSTDGHAFVSSVVQGGFLAKNFAWYVTDHCSLWVKRKILKAANDGEAPIISHCPSDNWYQMAGDAIIDPTLRYKLAVPISF